MQIFSTKTNRRGGGMVDIRDASILYLEIHFPCFLHWQTDVHINIICSCWEGYDHESRFTMEYEMELPWLRKEKKKRIFFLP